MPNKKLLLLIGLILFAEIYFFGSIGAIIFIIAMAFFQNLAYALQSRSRLRNSNLYHAIAAVTASGVFFATFRYLVINNLPFMLLPAYVIGTVAGSLKGNDLSKFIEKKIGAVTGEETDKNKNQFQTFWPSILFLCLLLSVQLGTIPYNYKIILAIVVLAFLDNFAFSIVSVTRNADNYWFHFGALLFQTFVKFISLKILVGAQMNWLLFLPSTNGGVIGSISGAQVGKILKEWLKASYDSHVKKEKKIEIPWQPIGVTCLLAIPQFVLFGFGNMTAISLLSLASFAQNISFSVVSRARQRSSNIYLGYSSIFSNGIWYLTAHLLVFSKLPDYMILPYTIGCVIGSLFGQDISIRIEKIIGAVMDDFSEKKIPKTVQA